MHLIESYATNCGVKIDKPYILERFFPLNVEKYITFQPFSKGAKSYDGWPDVLEIIGPVLDKAGIRIVQIGAPKEPQLPWTMSVVGQTNLSQVAYLVNHGMLHFGADSFAVHIASSYDKKIVALYSTSWINNCGPYWGTKTNQILLEPDRTDQKPSFSLEEFPKNINTIKPEKVALSILSLLGLEADYPYQTIYTGNNYFQNMLESVPDQVVNPKDFGVPSMIVRMDYNFNEDNLAKQLSGCPCIILTNKAINPQILLQFKQHVAEVIYIIEEDNDPSFVDFLEKNAFKKQLMTNLPEEELRPHKMPYMEYGIIGIRPKHDPTKIKELKDKDINKLFYKSHKWTLSGGKIYTSKAGYLSNTDAPFENKNPGEMPVIAGLTNMEDVHKVYPVVDHPSFWEDLDNFTILEKTD